MQKTKAMVSSENKTVKMTATPKQETPKQEKKLSYEDLERLAYQLSEQAKNMKAAIQERDNAIEQLKNQLGATNNTFARLEFLLEIIKNSNCKFGESFAQKCIEEVESIMELPKPKENEQSDEGKEDGVQAD